MESIRNINCNFWASDTVSVIVPFWDQQKLTAQCVEALQATKTSYRLDIILIDNGSAEKSRESGDKKQTLHCERLPSNRGFAAAVNRGLHSANGKYVAIMHNDVIVSKTWLDPLIHALESEKNIGAVGPMTNWTTGRQWEQAANYKGIEGFNKYLSSRPGSDEICAVPYLRSFCMVFPLDLIYRIGGFDERFFPLRFEDEDFCKRIAHEGLKCAIVKRSFVHHFGSLTLNNYPESPTAIIEKNRTRFAQKWGVPPEMGSGQIPFLQKGAIEGGCDVLHSSSGAVEALIEEGNQMAGKGDTAGAERAYHKILEQNPDSVEALHNLSILAAQQGDIQEAKYLIDRIHQLDPHFAPAYFTEGVTCRMRGESEKALQYFKEAISHNVLFAQAYDAYRQVAESTGKKVYTGEADIVFYTAGMSFDGETIYQKGLGGSESALFHMARSLAKLGLVVKVFNNCERPGVYENVEYGDLTDFYIFNYFNEMKVFISSRSFKPFQHEIHAGRLVVWLHDTVDVAYLKGVDFSKIDWERLEPFALSRWQARLWADFLKLPEEKFYVTRNGFDPVRFSGSEIARKRNKLIYSSRPCRGLEILLDLFPGIRQQIPDAELHVFAYSLSEKDEEIKLYKDKLNQPGVLFRGSVSQEELAHEMLEARVLTYPGIFEETSCITAIEAQAAGLPIVTSHLAALPETVAHGETGVLIKGDARTPEYQETFIREAVDLIRNDARWNRMSSKGKERAFSLFPWDSIAKEWRERLLGRSDASPVKPKISLCMIVKNEAALLPDFFNNIRDLADEIVVVDTGSTDETVSICESNGARVFRSRWEDDFALARNESLKHAAGEWILYLDPDERISTEDRQKIKKMVDRPDIAAISITEYIPQEQGNLMSAVASSYCRLFRNRPGVRFEGRIHEQILPSIARSGGEIVKSDVVIEHRHYGISDDKKKERAERNFRILMKELEEHPDDGFVLYNLGCTLRDSENTAEAKRYFQRLLSLPQPDVKPELLSSAAAYLGQIALKEGDRSEVVKMAREAILLSSSNLLAWYLEVAVAFEEKRYIDARDGLETILNLCATQDARNHFGLFSLHQVYLDLGNCCYKMNDFQNAHDYYAKSIEMRANSLEALFNDGLCLIQLNRTKDAKKLFTELTKTYPDFEPALSMIKRLSEPMMEVIE